jgi:hypothetical protein
MNTDKLWSKEKMQREKNSIFKCMKKYRTELKRYKQQEIDELIYAQARQK